MNRGLLLYIAFALLVAACSHSVVPQKSFDDICKAVEGKTTLEVEKLLGKPNSQETSAMGDERWVWWNYAVLDGDSYAPEFRGRVVHLEITFADPGGGSGSHLPHSQWRVRQPFGVSYIFPEPKKSI
jgi:hypothetical protein